MVYLSYFIAIFIFLAIFKPGLFKMLYEKLKVDRNYLAGLFASLGISALANKIDYIIYWNVSEILLWKYSIVFGIISLLVGLWLYKDKK